MHTDTKTPPKRKFKIKVNDEVLSFDKPKVTGSEILEEAGFSPTECHSLFQKLKGCDFEKISDSEKVDLSQPGIEKFLVKDSEIRHYWLDSQPETTDQLELTPNRILFLGGISPIEEYYLVEYTADGQEFDYEGRGNEKIPMRCPGSKFISARKGPTPFS